MISAMNVSAPVAEQILTFLGILEAAKDPTAVKEFLAQLQLQREGIANAEIALAAERQAVLAAQATAQAAIDELPRIESLRAEAIEACNQEQQKLSDARADLERREQELAQSRADWLVEVNSTGAAYAAEKRTLAQSWDELGLAQQALTVDQAQVDTAHAEVDALRASYEAKLAKLRAATAAFEGEQA